MSDKLKGNTRRIPQKHRITTFMNMKSFNNWWIKFCLDGGADGSIFFKKEKNDFGIRKHINKYLTISIDIVIE